MRLSRHCRVLWPSAKVRQRTDGFTSPPKEGMLRIFSPKNPTASAGFESARMLTTRAPKPLTSVIERGEGQRHAPADCYPRERPGTHLQEAGWAPGPVWTGAEKLAPTGIRSPDRPARSQSLYRLIYPAQTYQFYGQQLIYILIICNTNVEAA
jgi:hypothetical protein